MATCSSCGHENPEGNKFCGECASQLGVSACAVAEERKVVTSLFCDLVGFTATSEAADPEDVDRMLAAYFAVARTQIEGHGGVVEKFIGDAVVGVFGVPAAHEDDPERAVRAGLRIVEDAEALRGVGGEPLGLRVGINTGEALVRLGVSVTSGQGFLTGDAVNTASRIQSVAPEMGVAVGFATYKATANVFDYEEMGPASLKGKAGPVRVFRAKAPRTRLGKDLRRTGDTPLIGREIDLALLQGVFEKTVEANAVQVVTVVGEPGIGKSRLVSELRAYVDARPGLTTWRQGQCLPYGDGVTFWALGEILKAHAGILESDPPDVAQAKLDVVLPEGSEREWLRQRLLPLVGVEASSSGAREELFTAWRRFLELIAEADPTVLIFDDLHWADEALIAFLEHLADLVEGVPLLLVGTARPELYERHPRYLVGLRNVTSINLAPLSQEETGRLMSSLLEAIVIPAELQRQILDRAGGNPLYAEEFVRLLADRDSSSELVEDVPVPESVQALIAARLDTLTRERKGLLQDASVLGNVFWAGALAEMGERDPRDVERALHELSRKELVRPCRSSSMEGEQEYVFWHALVGDVCYAQVPRASRAARHRAAASWIERKAGARVDDLADVLAHHYVEALELDRAGQSEASEEHMDSARRFLALAGERALALDVAAAEAKLERALRLTQVGSPQRMQLLERWAQAALQNARLQDAKAALEEALALDTEREETLITGRVLTSLATVLGVIGDPRQHDVIGEAVALLDLQPPGPDLVGAYGELANARFAASDYEEAIAAAERALELADELGLPEPPRALGFRGASAFLGDRQGLRDMNRALALAVQQGRSRDAAILHGNLALARWLYEGPQAALAACQTGIEFCDRRGIAEVALWIAAKGLTVLASTGQPTEALAQADALAAQADAAGDVPTLIEVRSLQLRLLAERGEVELAPVAGEQLAAMARDTGEPQLLTLGLAAAARLLLAQGERAEATDLLEKLEQTEDTRDEPYYVALLPELVRCALALDDVERADRLVAGVEPRTTLHKHVLRVCRAQLAEATGKHADAAAAFNEAADRWRDFGDEPERAYALLGQSRCLIALGRQSEATPAIRAARAIFRKLHATPALAETGRLLQRAAALNS